MAKFEPSKRSKLSRTLNLNPNVSVDCTVFGFNGEELKVLLIDRQEGNGHADFAIPGDLILENEDLGQAAKRVLKELTGLDNIYLEQFYTFSDPNRISREKDLNWLRSIRAEPNARVITVAYVSLIRSDKYEVAASSFASRAEWCGLNELPELAFDHREIVYAGLEHLRFKLKFAPVGFELLPEKFTLGQLQKIYDAIMGSSLDKRNFRRKILKWEFLKPLEEKQYGVPHKPAQYYRFDPEIYENQKKDDFYFKL